MWDIKEGIMEVQSEGVGGGGGFQHKSVLFRD